MIDHRRFEPLQQRAADVEKAGAARAAQEFAAGGRQHVASGRFDIDLHLPDCLAGVQQVGNAACPRDLADRRRGIDEPAIGRDPGDRDQFDTLIDHALERMDVEFAAGIARHDFDDRARSLRDLKKGDIIGGVFRLGGQDPVARAKRKRVERHLPGYRCVLHERDFIRRGIQQPSD